MKTRFFFLVIAILCFEQLFSQKASNQFLLRSTISLSGASNEVIDNDKTFIIQQSIGQVSAIGTFQNNGYVLKQGFIQSNVLAKVMDQGIPLDLNVKVYPNPFIENISLSFNEEIKSEVKISLYDLLGRLLYENTNEPSKIINLSLSNLAVAHYILKVNADNKQVIYKIIKK